MEKVIIVAVAENGVIGQGSDVIPWRKTGEDLKKYGADMRRFAERTTPHAVIMGRATYLSIPQKYRPLEDRDNIVLTSRELEEDGIWKASSMEEALEMAQDWGHEKAYLAGGERVYQEGLEVADRLAVTHVKGRFDGDRYFPNIDPTVWREESREDLEHFSFVDYVRE